MREGKIIGNVIGSEGQYSGWNSRYFYHSSISTAPEESFVDIILEKANDDVTFSYQEIYELEK